MSIDEAVGIRWNHVRRLIFAHTFFPKTGRHGSVRKTPAANRTLTDLQVDFFFEHAILTQLIKAPEEQMGLADIRQL